MRSRCNLTRRAGQSMLLGAASNPCVHCGNRAKDLGDLGNRLGHHGVTGCNFLDELGEIVETILSLAVSCMHAAAAFWLFEMVARAPDALAAPAL